MEDENYDIIYKIEKSNWWYVAKRDLINRILAKTGRKFDRALDIGCGPGANIEVLNTFAGKVTGVDISPKAIEYSRRIHPHNEFLLANAENLPFADSSFDLILCSEVLEHVEDTKAIAEVLRILKPQGVLIITVPAHRYLWNFNDRFNHHLRRYNTSAIKILLGAPFAIKHVGYWNCISYLPALVLARLNHTSMGKKNTNNLYLVPKFMNNFLLEILKMENHLFQRNLSLQGVSLVCVAYKR